MKAKNTRKTQRESQSGARWRIMSELRKMCTILKHCLLKPSKPTKSWIEVTDECNSHCKMCNIWKKEPTKDLLTPEDYYKLFSDPFLSDVDSVIISGGEPFMRDDMYELSMAIHEANPKISIGLSTNGLQPEKVITTVRNLLRDGVTNLSVGTSIDCIGPKHDTFRGTRGAWGSVSRLIEGLKEIREQYPTLGICFGLTLQEGNYDEVESVIEYAEKQNVDYLIQWMNESSFYENKVHRDKEKEREVVEKLPERFSLLRELWIDWLDGKPINFDCQALTSFIAIKCDGSIVPCLSLWDDVAGNIRQDNIQTILKSEKAKLIREKVCNCQGCINSWGTYYSWEATGLPYVKYYAVRPLKFIRKLL